MATYIPQVTDYIPQIQPFQPDFNFFGNILQTKQTRYDSARKKVGDLYGSLLYAPLTGDNNIQRRDEFFKMIDQDIKKISGMDLSLQQNQDAAAKVFDGFFEDKNIMNDMNWTKSLMNAEQKHNAMMNCFDPVKCGGQGWQEGGMELQFKREDFRKASDAERMKIAAPTYTPYYNWQKDAMKAAKDAGYKVSRDELTGDYIVKKTNGDLITGGLYSVFKDAYGNDPRVEANYLTQAYVTRKITSKNDASLYGSEDAAEREYMGKIINKGLAGLHKDLETTNTTYDSTDLRIQELEKEQATKSLTKEKQAILDEAYAQRDALQSTKDYLEKNINSIKANAENGDLNILRSRSDNSQAQIHLQDDLKRLAKTLSVDLNSDLEIKTNPFAEIKKRFQADVALEHIRSANRKSEKLFEHDLNKEIEYIKLGKKVPGQSRSKEDYQLKEGVAGTNEELDLQNDPALGYKMNQEEWNNQTREAQTKANTFNHDAFIAAKQAGAKDYLDKVYGKGKWENVDVNDAEGYQKLIVGKNGVNIMNATLEHFKASTLNVGWGEALVMKDKRLITEAKMAQQAADGTLKFNIGVNKKVAEEMKAQVAINPLYRYVDELFIKTKAGGVSILDMTRADVMKEKGLAPSGFIDKYKRENLYASDAKAQEAYNVLYEDFFKRYNNERNKNASINTGFTLGGTGVISAHTIIASGVNPAERDPTSTNMMTKDLLTQIVNDDGSSFVGTGTNTLKNYENAISDENKNVVLKNVLRDVVRDINQSTEKTKDEKMHYYNIEVSAIGGEDSKVGTAKIYLDPDFIKSKAGKDNMISDAQAKELANTPIIAFFDKTKIKSKFIELSKDSNFQRTLKTNGFSNITDYEDIATYGPIKTTYNKAKDIVKYDLTFKQRNLDGTDTPVYVDVPSTNIAGAQAQYEFLLNKLDLLASNNRKVMRAEQELNKQKQQK